MSETFVPLVPAKTVSSANGFTALPSNGQSAKAAASVPSPATPSANGAAPAAGCVKPTITLQRDGDVVSSIRVQCACGQVIDINCAY